MVYVLLLNPLITLYSPFCEPFLCKVKGRTKEPNIRIDIFLPSLSNLLEVSRAAGGGGDCGGRGGHPAHVGEADPVKVSSQQLNSRKEVWRRSGRRGKNRRGQKKGSKRREERGREVEKRI